MLKRVITGVVAFIVFLPFLFFSDTYAFVAFWQAICLISAYELLKCTGLLSHLSVAIPTFAFAGTLPMFTRLFVSREKFFTICAIYAFLYLFVLASAAVFSKGRYKIPDEMLLFGAVFYVTVSISAIVMLRDEDCGQYVYLLAFITAWGSDIFAYFCGMLLGKHKLIPEVSPKKTVEGAVGGLLCCVGLTLLYGFLIGNCFGVLPNYLHLAIAGAVMSLASMLGDLIMSYIKRHYGIKDYGWLLPGHGGVLDRFDSVLATAPLLLIIYTVFSRFALFTL